MMVLVSVVATCPVSRDIVLAHGMPTHALCMWTRLTTHVAVGSIDVLAGTAPMQHSQVPRWVAGLRECYRTAPTAATSLWTVPLVRQRLAS